MDEFLFNNSQKTNLAFAEVVNLVKSFLEEDEAASYKLTIGSDSENKINSKNEKILELITAVVIYKKGHGGRYFWTRKHIKNTRTLRDKIYQEVFQSIETAKYLVPELKARLNGKRAYYDLEIHIDVGEKGETRDMIREVVGMVAGNGFVAKTKPDSYAASNIADRHV